MRALEWGGVVQSTAVRRGRVRPVPQGQLQAEAERNAQRARVATDSHHALQASSWLYSCSSSRQGWPLGYLRHTLGKCPPVAAMQYPAAQCTHVAYILPLQGKYTPLLNPRIRTQLSAPARLRASVCQRWS